MLMTFTLFVPNIECVKLILDRFTISSGLKVNYTKTKATWIGSCRQNRSTPMDLRETIVLKPLGQHLPSKKVTARPERRCSSHLSFKKT